MCRTVPLVTLPNSPMRPSAGSISVCCMVITRYVRAAGGLSSAALVDRRRGSAPVGRRDPSRPQHPFRIKKGGIARLGRRLGEGFYVGLCIVEDDGGRLGLIRERDVDDARNGRETLL